MRAGGAQGKHDGNRSRTAPVERRPGQRSAGAALGAHGAARPRKSPEGTTRPWLPKSPPPCAGTYLVAAPRPGAAAAAGVVESRPHLRRDDSHGCNGRPGGGPSARRPGSRATAAWAWSFRPWMPGHRARWCRRRGWNRNGLGTQRTRGRGLARASLAEKRRASGCPAIGQVASAAERDVTLLCIARCRAPGPRQGPNRGTGLPHFERVHSRAVRRQVAAASRCGPAA